MYVLSQKSSCGKDGITSQKGAEIEATKNYNIQTTEEKNNFPSNFVLSGTALIYFVSKIINNTNKNRKETC